MLFKNARASLARLISPPGLPTIALPVAGMEATPAMRIVAQAAPAAPVAAAAPLSLRPVASRAIAGPAMVDTFRLYEEQLKLDFDLESKLALAATPDAHRQIRAAFAQFRATKLRGKTMADIAKTPFALKPAAKAAPNASTDDDDTPQKSEPVDYAGIISTLEGIITDLKSKVPVDASDESDEASARAAAKSGRTSDAVDRLSALALKLQAKVKVRSALLSEPSSPSRARRLIASGFANDPVVAQVNQSLGRGDLSLAQRSSLALAPIGGHREPAKSAPVASRPTTAIDGTVYRSLRAERAKLNEKARKDFCFDQKFRAEDARLKAAIDREIQKTRPQ